MRSLARALVATLGLVACSDPPSSSSPDATPVDAAVPRDLAPTTRVGDPCTTTDATCSSTDPQVQQGTCGAGQVCLPNLCGARFPLGYCSVAVATVTACQRNRGCPTGSTCIQLPGTDLLRCLRACSDDSDCRTHDGYSCQDPSYSGRTVCYPAGGTDDGRACVPPPQTPPSAGFAMNSLAPPGGASDTVDAEGNVAVDGAGHALVGYIEVDTQGNVDEDVAAWSDPATGGIGFATAPQIFTAKDPNGMTSDPVLAVDRETNPPRAFLAYMDIDGSGAAQIVVARSDMNGARGSWSPTVAVSGAAGNLDKPWVVARAGVVVVTWGDVSSGQIWLARSSDNGATWQPPERVDDDGAYKDLATPALDASGNVWVAWFEDDGKGFQIRLAAATAGASGFAPSVRVSGAIPVQFDDPAIDVTPDGKTVWLSFSDHDAATGSDIWATVSHDGGQTFSTPVRVNDDAASSPKAPLPCATHYQANLAVDAQGRAHIAWDDDRWGLDDGAVMYAYSTSDTTFSHNGVVSSSAFRFDINRGGPLWLGDYLGVAVDASQVYVAWADSRSGNTTRMYLAVKPLE